MKTFQTNEEEKEGQKKRGSEGENVIFISDFMSLSHAECSKRERRVSFQSMFTHSSTSKCSQIKYLYLKNVFE